MSSNERQDTHEARIDRPTVAVRRRRGPSIVWLIPMIAALIGAGLWYETWSERGPRITIEFRDASGLEAGKTKIKYKAMEIGQITELEFTDDLGGVIAHAELERESTPYLSEDTSFWVVRPHIGASGISGLDTLVSGAYVGVLPATGEKRRHFVALNEPPLRAQHLGALGINLRAEHLGSIREGSPVYYRNIQAGEVERYVLDEDGRGVTIHLLIDREFAHLVREETQFWNASGIEASLSATGIKFHMSSVAALLSGGIVFDNTKGSAESPKAENDATFSLHGSPDEALAARQERDGFHVYVEAERLGGVTEGAAVYYRDLQVGRVADQELSADARAVRFRLQIDAEHASLVRRDTRFFKRDAIRVHAGLDGIDIEAGSLAQMMAGGIGIATPTRVAQPAKAGDLFPLHDKAKSTWLAWSPTIWLDADHDRSAIQHVALHHRKPAGLALVLEAPATGSTRTGAPIHYRNVEVGRVSGHELSPDAKTVRIHAHVEARYARLVRDNSVFWNTSGVRVHAGLDGVDIDTGSLKSLIDGGITFATPDEVGEAVEAGHMFHLRNKENPEWLAWAPEIWIDGDARPVAHVAVAARKPEPLRVVLEAESARSVREGAPIYYRKIRIGKLGKHALRPDGRRVLVDALIDAEHAELVRDNTVFWNAAGLDAHLSLRGLKIQTESLEAFIEGGVALATPDPAGSSVEAGQTFVLHTKAQDEWRTWAPALDASTPEIVEPSPSRAARIGRWFKRLVKRDRARSAPMQTANTEGPVN